MYRVIRLLLMRRANFVSAAAILLYAACGGPSGESANEQCGEQDVHALTPANDYVIRFSTADTGGIDECGIQPSRLVGAKAKVVGGSSGYNASILLPEASPSEAPIFGGLFQGNIACNHGKLTSIVGFIDDANRCEYWLFQMLDATVVGRDEVALQVAVQKTDHRGCSPSGDACHSYFVMELARP